MNLFELFVKIDVNDQASKKIGAIRDGIGSGLKTAAGIGLKAITAAAAGIATLTGLAIKNYAEYEQLVGGVETLFGNSANKVKSYAAEAYKSAGLSANEYMNTVTSFSASLLQSLGGDTEKAADYANRALTDMSDNANKMGTSMEMIQNAYQGFAKQNYTMLDNLKLGYGGTKSEMERLINDAAALTEIQKELNITVKAGDTSFANIVNAISVVQSKMGIMGTTAAEASTTISGSLNSMKAAWQNLLTGIADDDADFDQLINNMVESVGSFGENIIPRIEIALGGIAKLIETLIPKIGESIPNLIGTLLPTLVSAAVNLIKTIANTMKENYDMITATVVSAAMAIVTGLLDILPTLTGVGFKMALALIIGISKQLPTLLPAVIDCVVMLVETLISPESISMLIDAAVELILGLTIGLQRASMALSLHAPELLIALIEGLLTLTVKLNGVGVQLMKGLWEGMKGTADWLWQKVKEMLNGLMDKIKDFFGIASPSKLFRDEIGSMLAKGIGVGFNDEIKNVSRSMKKGFGNLTGELDTSLTYGTYETDGTVLSTGGKRVSIVQNIYSQKQTAADIMQEAQWNAERAVYMGV